MRLQLALNVRDIDEAVDYYGKLFNAAPHKRRPGYANFALAEPPLKLVLIENPHAPERINHLGVELFDAARVQEAGARLEATHILDEVEERTVCCHAEQTKVWSREPQGLRWEWYAITDDAPAETATPACCDPPPSTASPEHGHAPAETDPACCDAGRGTLPRSPSVPAETATPACCDG